jgi:bacteriorhodopsin
MDTSAKNRIKNSFMISYLVLMGYTTITLVESLRTTSVNTRHIMNLETSISLVAAVVYGVFIEMTKTPDFNLQEVTNLRYVDWVITTPLIILTLLLFYNQTVSSISFKTFLIVICLNWLMLLSGYFGEMGSLDKKTGVILGFGALSLMLGSIYTCCIPSGSNMLAFAVFTALWSGYGFAYLLDEEKKNLAYNALDVFSKAIFGVGLWLYYGRVLKFN